jgi:hypothetical protein
MSDQMLEAIRCWRRSDQEGTMLAERQFEKVVAIAETVTFTAARSHRCARIS